jgi:hypothetical protein
VHLGPVAELGLELVGDPRQEVGFGRFALLELVERMAALTLGDPLHRDP